MQIVIDDRAIAVSARRMADMLVQLADEADSSSSRVHVVDDHGQIIIRGKLSDFRPMPENDEPQALNVA